jgi:cytochrome c biogenesis protein CcmG/thiol:disulfide interchange protein DsbE
MNGGPDSTRSTTLAVGLVLILLAGFALVPRLVRGQSAARVGREAPDFTLDLVANGGSLGADKPTLTLSELRGRPVLLDFWATWCEPCRLQAPIVEQVARRWRERGLAVVGVNTDMPGQGDPRAFALSHGLSYAIVHDRAGNVAREYDVEDLPTLIVVSRLGKVSAMRTGVTDGADLERLVEQAR